MNKNIIRTGLILLVAFVLFSAGCSGSGTDNVSGDSIADIGDKNTDSFFAMGSFISQTVYGGEDSLLAAVRTEISEAENLMSEKIDTSPIYMLNSTKRAVFEPEIYDVLRYCAEISAVTDGAFDISLLWLTELWDIEGLNPSVPEPSEIEEALQKTGYENIIFKGNNTVELTNDIMVDLGAAGKGYACDIAIDAYKKAEVSGLIAVGGSIGHTGLKPDGTRFKVGIRDPFDTDINKTIGWLETTEGFVSTSGNYEKYFVQDGKRYHHILDPKTGYPVENELVSVSIYCNNGMLSDILSTACFVLGKEESLKMLGKYNAQAVFITEDKTVYVTEGLRGAFNLTADLGIRYIELG